MDIILSLRTYFELNFGSHYPVELIYFIVGLYQKLTQWNIRCGISHNFLFNSTKIYSWGHNDEYQLGLNHQQNTKMPQKVNFDFAQIVDIICGYGFSIMRTSDGDVYICGFIAQKIYNVPTKINLKNIKKIFGGYCHCFMADDESVYASGSNANGQLGLGITTDESLKLTLDLKSVIEIACGAAHSIALLFNHDVYSWGSNESGELGLGDNKNQSQPQKLDFVDCISVACGSHHSLLLTITGEVYSCGSNSCGQLGLGYRESRNSLQKLQLKNIRAIHAKGAHSMCVSDNNDLYAWGINECGELGLGHHENKKLPQKVKLGNIKEIDSGHGYTIIVTLKNEVYAWGKQIGSTPQRLMIG